MKNREKNGTERFIDPDKGRRKYTTADGIEVFEGTSQPSPEQVAENAAKETIETEKFLERLKSNPRIFNKPESRFDEKI